MRASIVGTFALASLSLVMLTAGCRPNPEASDPSSAHSLDAGKDTDAHAVGEEPSAIEDGPQPDDRPRPTGAIFRDELRRATKDGSAAYLLSALDPEPYRPQGRFEGWVITRLWPQDPQLCAPGCDLYVGDIILSVNGSRLQTPEELSNMLERLEEIDQLDVRGIREGQYFERSFPIVAAP